MNPQVHYTPQQQMGFGGYSVPCRTGNWAEDEYMGALNTQVHQAKASEGMLTSQRLASTQGAALAPATLAPAPADGAVRFGDCVMLSAALGGVVAFDTANALEAPGEAFAVTRTREEGAVACVRTTWTVTPAKEGEAPEDGLLRIGTPFMLVGAGADGAPIYLQSTRYTITNQNYAGSGGKGQRAMAVLAPSAECLWTVEVLDPSDLAQMTSAGMPVPANTFVAFKHVTTQSLLYTDTTKVLNKYATESEVSTLTASSITKSSWGKRSASAVGVGNHFAFTTAEATAAPAPEAA